jgi:hypothetical protein
MLGLARSARLAAWAGCWLAGDVTLDEVVTRVRGDDEPHIASGQPDDAPNTSLGSALDRLRASGARGLRVALPRPGDPHGLTGPRELTEAAVAAGEAVVCVGVDVALVPTIATFGPPGDRGTLVTWAWRPANPPPPVPALSEVDRALTSELRDAGSTLAGLDVAAWRPDAVRLLDDLRSSAPAAPLPRSFPPAAQTLAARAVRVLSVVDFALADDGLALTATAAQDRRDALVSLERGARHALAAACNALAD